MRVKSTFEHFTKKFANVTLPIETNQPKSKKIGSNTTNFEGQTSLGVMMKRNGEAMGPPSSPYKKIGANFGKKQSIFQNLLDKKRLSSFTMESYDKNYQEDLVKDTATKIKALFTANISHFFAQISENSIKGNAFQANVLGKTPECIKSVNFTEGISGLDSPTQSFKRLDNHRKMTTDANSVSMKGQMAKFKASNTLDLLKDDVSGTPNPSLKKAKSEQVPGPDLDANLSKEYYENLKARQSEKVPIDLNVIDEEEEVTVDIDRSKFIYPDKEGGGGRNQRTATFKPIQVPDETERQESKETPDTVIKILHPPVSQEPDKQFMKSIKDRIFKEEEPEQQSNEPIENDDDSELENKVLSTSTSQEQNYFGITSKAKPQPVKKVEEQKVYMYEQTKKNDQLNTSQKSSSKYSLPESESHDKTEFVVSTANNKIKDTVVRKTAETKRVSRQAPNRDLSIRTIQTGLNRFQNNAADTNSLQDPYSANLNHSQQQAINMLGKEAGNRRNSPYSGYMPPQFSQTPKEHSRSNSSSPMRSHNPSMTTNPLNGAEFQNSNFGNQMAPHFGTPMTQSDALDSNANSMMNPMMVQMMMLMQQNQALITQQTEMMKSLHSNNTKSDYSKSRSRSRPRGYKQPAKKMRRGDPNIDSKSQIQNTGYSELDFYHGKDDESENIDDTEDVRADNTSIERKHKLNRINEMSLKSNTPTNIRNHRKERFLKGKPKEEKIVQDKTLGIIMLDVKCKINPHLKLLEGDIVTVEKFLPELDLYQCRSKNQVGMYPKDAVKIVKKKGQRLATKNDKSEERRMESIEREATKYKSSHKNKGRRNYKRGQLEVSDDEDTYRGDSIYDSKNIDKDSQNEILPYNSLKQSDHFQYGPSGEEVKRLSKEGDFTKISQSALEHYDDDISNPEDVEKATPKRYYEPKNDRRAHDKVSDDNILTSKFRSEGSEQYPNYQPQQTQKIPKAAKRKANKANKNAKFIKTGTFVDTLNPLGLAIGTPGAEQDSFRDSAGVNDSMSSNQSSLNRSLKLQQRKQRRQGNPARTKNI